VTSVSLTKIDETQGAVRAADNVSRVDIIVHYTRGVDFNESMI
jgi:hypothetical protein